MTERVQQDRNEFARAKRDTWNQTNYGDWFKFARGEVIDILEKAALAIVVVGGLISATALTLILLPILYERFGFDGVARE